MMKVARAKIAACQFAKLVLYPFASVGWAVICLYQSIDLIQGRLTRDAGLDREWNEWCERQPGRNPR